MRYASVFSCLIAAVLMTFAFSGCGAMFNGSTKSIHINASPSGTKLSTQPPTGDFTAPTTLQLERKNAYVLNFSKEGYNSASVQIQKKAQFGIILLDVLFTGLIGVVVDATTGAWNNLSPDQVSVSLEKLEGASVDGPDTIEISLNSKQISENQNSLTIDATEPVSVEVTKCSK